MSESPAIETDSLRKEYGEAIAVRSLDLTVPQGAVYGFLGPNGAGKTSTIQILTTLQEPTSGTATVAGESIGRRERVTPHIGYLPEEPPVYPELTGRENLEYVAGLRGIEADERIESLLDRFGLTDGADRAVSGYSKGMKQKLGLIGALLHEPDVLFLDEPTAGLDPRAARAVKDTIADVSDRGVTVFLSTHILPVVEELGDQVGVLQDGRLVAEGPPDELGEMTGEGADLEDVFLNVTRSRSSVAAPADQ
ncbi:ABC transporter ATP-binding protein [Halorhabdus sp. CBA1104]|uniref:ABC transporter ATP-binding protein n=1 Tax=Halorhabdus sp. CBA1104 TaxID=1380432 RepID=UPI0012B19290|nr:ABC transporter ATP-binding protein [Halorhabdus sp. CBA1104]QGN07364.1 ABC transporter ATP-binding protein [Halorhabdus sp. CBA1104]